VFVEVLLLDVELVVIVEFELLVVVELEFVLLTVVVFPSDVVVFVEVVVLGKLVEFVLLLVL
jgi:hypothetical protein